MSRFTYVEFNSYKSRKFEPCEKELDHKVTFDNLLERRFKSELFDAAYLIDNRTGKLVDSYVKRG